MGSRDAPGNERVNDVQVLYRNIVIARRRIADTTGTTRVVLHASSSSASQSLLLSTASHATSSNELFPPRLFAHRVGKFSGSRL